MNRFAKKPKRMDSFFASRSTTNGFFHSLTRRESVLGEIAVAKGKTHRSQGLRSYFLLTLDKCTML